jgi:DnaJ domain
MTDSAFDPYVVLGVERTASADEIQAAYRRAAAKAHPDREGGSKEAMTDVNMAYEILKDPAMRAQFDSSGKASKTPPLDVLARDKILSILTFALRNSSDPFMDLIDLLRLGISKQHEGLKDARQKTMRDITLLKLRASRVKGPVGNFIEGMILNEIGRGEECLHTFDADEQVMLRAIEILKDYRYGDDYTVLQGLPFQPLPHGILSGYGGT